jgi:AcrR family transcriptional regulator
MVPFGTEMQAQTLAPPLDEHRLRLLEGFAAAISEKGYAVATIADIVRHARVSKRTFYEQFPGKEACLLATYAAVTRAIRESMRAAFEENEAKGWPAQLGGALDAYVTALESAPALTRACLVEMAAAGPKALKLRRQVHEEFAALLRDLVDRARKRHPELRAVSASMATAIVGGIDELLLAQVELGLKHRLANVRDTASELLHAILTSAAPSSVRARPEASTRAPRRNSASRG